MCSFLLTTLRLLNLTHVNYYLQVRGPDHTAHRAEAGFEFVHNLLSQTGGLSPQPLVSADGRTLALFNGEIYNFRELEQALRPAGPAYASDGAAVLDAYAHWGASFATHLDGEFAIAVVDLAKQLVVLAVDPFGVKPLFVADGDEGAAHFGASSYRSGLVRAGHARQRQLAANSAYVFRFDVDSTPSSGGRPTNFRLVRSRPVHTWELHQHKKSAGDWEAAFLAAVRKRTMDVKPGRLFLPLSSGCVYACGTAECATTVPHTSPLSPTTSATISLAEAVHKQCTARALVTRV